MICIISPGDSRQEDALKSDFLSSKKGKSIEKWDLFKVWRHRTLQCRAWAFFCSSTDERMHEYERLCSLLGKSWAFGLCTVQAMVRHLFWSHRNWVLPAKHQGLQLPKQGVCRKSLVDFGWWRCPWRMTDASSSNCGQPAASQETTSDLATSSLMIWKRGATAH